MSQDYPAEFSRHARTPKAGVIDRDLDQYPAKPVEEPLRRGSCLELAQ
jgi:hypothetical protein